MQVDNQVIVLERVPYLGALEVCSRQGAIQIHIYLYLYDDDDDVRSCADGQSGDSIRLLTDGPCAA